MNIKVSDSICVTEFRRSDAAALVRWLNEPEIYARTLRIPSPYTAADAENWLNLLETPEDPQTRLLAAAIRDGDGQVIGGIGLERRGDLPADQAELGYWLAKPYWGRGIMRAVVGAVYQQAFATFDLAKITAHVFSFNDPSARVLEKCGFQFEGWLKEHVSKDGRMIDIRLFGLSRPTTSRTD